MSRAKVIFSTRIWKFQTDEIRLSALSNTSFLDFMRESMRFTSAEIAVPQYPGAEFRAVSPPGISLMNGLAPVDFDAEGEPQQHIAVRSLGIDANTIAIQVAGSSRFADEVYEYLKYLVGDSTTPEGDPFVGTHRSVLDFSLIALSGVPRSAAKLAGVPFFTAMKSRFNLADDAEIAAELSFRLSDKTDRSVWLLRPRFGTVPEEGILESQAWLSSDDHLDLLRSVDGLLPPEQKLTEQFQESASRH
jgi:hypothetical protein